MSVACVSDTAGNSGGSGSSGGDNGGDNTRPSNTPSPSPSQTPGGGTPTPTPGDGEETEEPDGGDSGGQTGGGATTAEPTASPTPGDGGSALTGSASDVLGALVAELLAAGVDMPMAFPGPPPEVSAELSHNTIGLTEDDFLRLVTSASYSQAAIGTFAHQISMIQANDAGAASEVKKLVSGDNGFDPQKWICVWPERVSAVDAGQYVLIVASHISVVEAAIDTFRNTAGSTGDVVTFWEFTGD